MADDGDSDSGGDVPVPVPTWMVVQAVIASAYGFGAVLFFVAALVHEQRAARKVAHSAAAGGGGRGGVAGASREWTFPMVARRTGLALASVYLVTAVDFEGGMGLIPFFVLLLCTVVMQTLLASTGAAWLYLAGRGVYRGMNQPVPPLLGRVLFLLPALHHPVSMGVVCWSQIAEQRLGKALWHLTSALMVLCFCVLAAYALVVLPRQLQSFVTSAPRTFDVSHIHAAVRRIRTVLWWFLPFGVCIAAADVNSALSLLQTLDEGLITDPSRDKEFLVSYVVDWFIGGLVGMAMYMASPFQCACCSACCCCCARCADTQAQGQGRLSASVQPMPLPASPHAASAVVTGTAGAGIGTGTGKGTGLGVASPKSARAASTPLAVQIVVRAGTASAPGPEPASPATATASVPAVDASASMRAPRASIH